MRLFVCFAVIFLCAGSASAADQGRVAAVSGSFTVNGKAAAVGTAVSEGDTLETAKNASADVVMQSGVRFRLYGESKVVIPADSRSHPLRLAWGRLLSIVKPGRPFAVAGRTGVAGVRGTTFYVESAKDRRTYVCICKGKLHLTGEGKDHGDVAAEHHAGYSLDGSSRSDEPMLGHTDQEITELAGR